MRVWLTLLLALSISASGGCQSQSRVFYEGRTCKKVISKAELSTLTSDQLIESGYQKIGIFKSEPTTHGQSISKNEFQKNPEKMLDSIAPENAESLRPYYESLDKEICQKAADMGGQLVRLEKIDRTYPAFKPEIEALMEKTMASDLVVKNVTSIKSWSVWRKD
jgi:hypothetical protein